MKKLCLLILALLIPLTGCRRYPGILPYAREIEDMELIRKTCKETYLEECEVNPNFKKVYDSMMAYRDAAANYRDWTGDYGFGYNVEE